MNELWVGQSSFTERTNMSTSLPEILFSGQLAKKRLDEVFDITDCGHRPPPVANEVRITAAQRKSAQCQPPAPDLTYSRDIFRDARRKQSRSRRSSRSDGDMTASCFILTLLLIATIIAAYTDRPIFWLSIGPFPLAAGVALIACLQQGRLPHLRVPRCKSGSNCSA
jgi:hypothetical protein